MRPDKPTGNNTDNGRNVSEHKQGGTAINDIPTTK